MNYCKPLEPDKPAPWNLQTHGSGLVERVLEYQFLGALTAELLCRGMRFEVLRGDFDLDGYDLVVEADGISRHIQLKGMVAGGKTSRVPVNTRLSEKPSGCVIWMSYDPASLAVTSWRWFGGSPGAGLPELGGQIARHTGANSDGIKAFRPNIRILAAGQFSRVSDIASLADLLFGPASLALLRRHLRSQVAGHEPQPWLRAVRMGDFAAIPEELGWDDSVYLAHLINGYELAEVLRLGSATDYEGRQLAAAEKSGVWAGDAIELWITLFLEHRRWRFSHPHEPGSGGNHLLDQLVHQLHGALLRETTS